MRGVAAIAVVVSIASIGTSVSAAPLTRAQKAKIELHKRAAEKASFDANYADAAAQIDQALRVAPDDPELVLLLARAYDAWGDRCQQTLSEMARFFSLCRDCPQLAKAKSDLLVMENRCVSDVTIESTPSGAIVEIAGQEYARAAPFTTALKPGAYSLLVRRHGYLPRRIEAKVEPATALHIPVTLESAPVLEDRSVEEAVVAVEAPPAVRAHETPVASYVALGVGAAGGVAGAIFTWQSMAKVDDERTARYEGADKEEVESLRSSAKTNAALAVTGFAIAVAGFAASILFELAAE